MDHKRFKLMRCRRSGVEAVEADTTLAFGRHTHEQFGVGLIERGAHRSARGRGAVEACAGDIITVNPGEVHDGAPLGDGGRAWRILYFDPGIVIAAVADITEGKARVGLEFSRPALSDPRIGKRFKELYSAMTTGDTSQDELRVDETLLMLLGDLLRPASGGEGSVPAGIVSARGLIDDDPAAALTLDALARQADLSRYQFLRSFARATGLTPHAYLMQRRIHRARKLIASGARLSDAAASSGFADQSHMTRLFVRSFGMAPGVYAKAMG
jgi:AraC-like DNA-binding protein